MTVTLEHPRYHFDRWIAGGGMGEVWQATDTLLDREVAVKVLRSELAEDAVLRARFAAEARHAGALQHPHVASVLDYGEITGAGPTPLPFLVMELVDGQPLSALLADGRALPPRKAADLIAQAAEGIEAAHAIGIVHRDVKPGNLLVTPEGQVKVTDFGVARAADTASLTMTGHLIGTPHYISPEQAEGAAATPVSDVYAIGIVLFECLTGRKPFAGDTPVVTALMHIREPLPPFPDHVPDRLRRITRIATAKDPVTRFRSAGAMAAALRDESPETRTYLLPDPAARSAGDAERRHQELLSARRVLALLMAVLLTIGGLWATTGASDDTTDAPPAKATTDAAAELVRVRAADYRGRPLAAVRRELRELGLRPRADAERRPNQGGHQAGTIAGVAPAGLLETGTPVQLTAWGAPPARSEEPVPDQLDVDVADDAGATTGAPSGSVGSTQDRAGQDRAGGDSGAAASGGGGGSGGRADNPGRASQDSKGKAPAHSNAGGGGNGRGKSNGGGNGPGKGSGKDKR